MERRSRTTLIIIIITIVVVTVPKGEIYEPVAGRL